MATRFGDTTGSLVSRQHGRNQSLTGDNTGTNRLIGDAETLLDRAEGGDDSLTGGSGFAVLNYLYGDAHGEMRDRSEGGDDEITGGSGVNGANHAYGDAETMAGDARGGDDVLTGGNMAFGTNWFYGDAFFMEGEARGGDDRLTGASGSVDNLLIGDAFEMSGKARGGDDTLIGGEISGGPHSRETIFGDGYNMSGSARGGDDLLIAGPHGGSLYGDANVMAGRTKGGDDRLVSGAGPDRMFGDTNGPLLEDARGGEDVFVFRGSFGNDLVGDFRHGEDRLEFHISGLRSMRDLDIAVEGADTVITVEGHGSVVLEGYTAPLRPSDFDFC